MAGDASLTVNERLKEGSISVGEVIAHLMQFPSAWGVKVGRGLLYVTEQVTQDLGGGEVYTSHRIHTLDNHPSPGPAALKKEGP